MRPARLRAHRAGTEPVRHDPAGQRQALPRQQTGALSRHEDAIKAGIGYVSEDRLTLGTVQQQSVADNAVLTILDKLRGRFRLIDDYRKNRIVAEWIAKLGVRVADPEQAVSTLSGGNQQKIVLAKWVLTQPRILILDSPTVGVDVGAKASIYQLIHLLAQEGSPFY